MKIRNIAKLTIFMLMILSLSACSSYKYCLNMSAIETLKNSNIQIDVVGADSTEYSELKEISYEDYWKLVFDEQNFPATKESFSFGMDMPKNQILNLSSIFWKQCKDQNLDYLMILAYFPEAPNETLDKFQKTSSWKITIPLDHNDWWGMSDENLYIAVMENKILLRTKQ